MRQDDGLGLDGEHRQPGLRHGQSDSEGEEPWAHGASLVEAEQLLDADPELRDESHRALRYAIAERVASVVGEVH